MNFELIEVKDVSARALLLRTPVCISTNSTGAFDAILDIGVVKRRGLTKGVVLDTGNRFYPKTKMFRANGRQARRAMLFRIGPASAGSVLTEVAARIDHHERAIDTHERELARFRAWQDAVRGHRDRSQP